MSSFQIKFWGVRGSIPTPGPRTIRYGGNTPCVEVQFTGGPLFILDAGSGIRDLGNHLLQRPEPVEAFIFISHFHWDHIQGLPFFRPAYKPGNRFTILGSDDAAMALDQIIAFQMNPTYFPVAIQDMQAEIHFRSLREESFQLQGVQVETIYLNHPGYTLGYRFTYRGKSLVYFSDNEPFQTHLSRTSEEKVPKENNLRRDRVEDLFDNFVENKNEQFVAFCRGADVLIHDSQYFPNEYQLKQTWGHSPFTFTVELAIQSQVKHLILFHHDPDHSDEIVEEKLKSARAIIAEHHSNTICHVAREGWCFEL